LRYFSFSSQKGGEILQNPVVTTVVLGAGKLVKSINDSKCLNKAFNFGMMNNNNKLEGEKL
jgi:hypothetical protein